MALPLIPLIAAGVGLAGVGGSAATNIGRNTNTHQNFGDSQFYDKNRFEYGGRPGQADYEANKLAQQQRANFNQQGLYQQQQAYGFGRGAASLDNSAGARGEQAQALGLMRARAMGQAPLIAQMQGNMATNQALAAQASQMAGARGPGGLALAQQNAANNSANAQSQIAAQTQMAAAQEQLGYQQAYAQQAAQMRGADQGDAQIAFGAAGQSGGLGIQSGQLGLGYAGEEGRIRQQQMMGGIEQQRILSGSQSQGQSLEAQQDQANAARDMAMLKMALGAGQDAAGAAGAVGKRAMGGPVQAGQPYVVGEFGPELVVPGADGFVLNHKQTQGLMAGAAGPAEASAYQLGPGGLGVDVMNTMKANNAAALKYAHNPVGGPVARGLFG